MPAAVLEAPPQETETLAAVATADGRGCGTASARSAGLPIPPTLPAQPPLLAYSSTEAVTLSDDALIGAQRGVAEQRRLLDASAAVLAAEIAHRSRRELGHDGLAQRRGARSAEVLIQQVTGVSQMDARSLVRVGTIVTQFAAPLADPVGDDPLGDAEPSGDGDRTAVRAPDAPWLESVADAVSLGELSVAAAEAIRVGLGEPNEHVTVPALADAASALVREAREVTLERLAASARAHRDALDAAGIALREQERRERRYLHLIPQADGMTRITGLLDPESAAIISGAVDAITAPRRGGPRFVDSEQAARAKAIEDDPRTTPQLALDGLVELIRVATLADRGRVLGARRVGVRVHVAERDLRRGVGAARMEGQTEPISIATAERLACESGVLPIAIGLNGQPLDVGRTQRTFTARQRIALAARDGGCRWPGCDRPPEWTEAHHINEWLRHGGRTDLADGLLLCRQHHMLVHNHGWRVIRTGAADYQLLPPPGSERGSSRQRASVPAPVADVPEPAAPPIPMPARPPVTVGDAIARAG